MSVTDSKVSLPPYWQHDLTVCPLVYITAYAISRLVPTHEGFYSIAEHNNVLSIATEIPRYRQERWCAQHYEEQLDSCGGCVSDNHRKSLSKFYPAEALNWYQFDWRDRSLRNFNPGWLNWYQQCANEHHYTLQGKFLSYDGPSQSPKSINIYHIVA